MKPPNVADSQTLFSVFGEPSVQPVPTIPIQVQDIRDQFRDTPIAAVYEDFSEGAEITPEQLRNHVSRHLCSALRQVDVYEAGAERRTAAIYGAVAGYAYSYGFELYDEFEADEDIDEPALEYARPIWDIMARLEPAIAANLDDEVVVHFTPVVKSEEQLILYEHREHSMYVKPAVSTHFLKAEEEQYRVFIRDEHSVWQQQSVLPFFTVSVYRDEPTKLAHRELNRLIEESQNTNHERVALKGEINVRYAPDEDNAEKRELEQRLQALQLREEELDFQIQICEEAPLRRHTVIPAKPYASELFNFTGTTYQGKEVYRAVLLEGEEEPQAFAYREVFAKLPKALNIPPASAD